MARWRAPGRGGRARAAGEGDVSTRDADGLVRPDPSPSTALNLDARLTRGYWSKAALVTKAKAGESLHFEWLPDRKPTHPMTTQPRPSPNRGRRILVGLGQFLLGLVLVIVGIGVWSLPSRIAGSLIGGALMLSGAVLAFHGLLKVAGGTPTATATPSTQPPPPPVTPDWSAVVAAHQDELQALPAPQRRGDILHTWRRVIDQQAHDYADLVLATPSRQEQILQTEVEAMMMAYFQGYMAGRGWAEPDQARVAAFTVGRTLRDRLRALDLPIDQLRTTLGTVIDRALREITELGLTDGAERRS